MAYADGTVKYYAKVSYDGLVKQRIRQMFQSNCNMDMSQMPFDTQVCYLGFGSLETDISKVRIG
jgi:hypothetical protein